MNNAFNLNEKGNGSLRDSSLVGVIGPDGPVRASPTTDGKIEYNHKNNKNVSEHLYKQQLHNQQPQRTGYGPQFFPGRQETIKSIPREKSIWSLYAKKTILVHREYVLSKIIGKGSFGVVRQGFHKDTLEPVAIKLEEVTAKNRVLAREYQVYKQIWTEDCGLPEIFACGKKDDYHYLVMQILGSSIEELFTRCSRSFSLKTVLMLGDQMIERLRYMHDKGFLHRDIKPENFLIGTQEDCNKIYLVDLGLAKQWRTEAGHVPYRTGNRIIGTARYASINSHLGYQLSRRDDMESLGYLLVYFAKGRLPWQAIRGRNKDDKYTKICEKKRELPLERLCNGLPKEFILYFKHVQSLRFDERPSYDYLKGLILTAFSNTGYEYDHQWDWA